MPGIIGRRAGRIKPRTHPFSNLPRRAAGGGKQRPAGAIADEAGDPARRHPHHDDRRATSTAMKLTTAEPGSRARCWAG
jgi:hypothetical protein